MEWLLCLARAVASWNLLCTQEEDKSENRISGTKASKSDPPKALIWALGGSDLWCRHHLEVGTTKSLLLDGLKEICDHFIFLSHLMGVFTNHNKLIHANSLVGRFGRDGIVPNFRPVQIFDIQVAISIDEVLKRVKPNTGSQHHCNTKVYKSTHALLDDLHDLSEARGRSGYSSTGVSSWSVSLA